MIGKRKKRQYMPLRRKAYKSIVISSSDTEELDDEDKEFNEWFSKLKK